MAGYTFSFPLFPNANGNMNGTATATSIVIDMRTHYATAIALYWTTAGSPVGTFSIQGSLDYVATGISGNTPNAGTWDDMAITPADLPGGGASHTLIDITATGIPYIRIVYTNSSGTGTLTGLANTKG